MEEHFRVNIYEMAAARQFLLEFPTKHMTEQVLQGEWTWKKEKIQIECWSPVAGCCTDIQETEWTSIIAMGLPYIYGLRKPSRLLCGVG